jgi:hypothetical protein
MHKSTPANHNVRYEKSGCHSIFENATTKRVSVTTPPLRRVTDTTPPLRRVTKTTPALRRVTETTPPPHQKQTLHNTAANACCHLGEAPAAVQATKQTMWNRLG